MAKVSGYGAVDLAALAAARKAGEEAAARAAQRSASGGPNTVVDVTDATFEAAALQPSLSYPVVLELWANWAAPSKQLSPILGKLADEYAGRFLLARVDIDTSPGIAQAFSVQSIPSVFALVGGRPVPLFQGALPENAIRQYVDELLKVAAANGITGRVAGAVDQPEAPQSAPAAPQPTVDPRFDAAFDAIEAGDWPAARKVYEKVLAETPGDPLAVAGLAQLGLLERTEAADPVAVLQAADAAPDDRAAQLRAADVLVLANRPVEAFARLIGLIRFTAGPDREPLRRRLLELFEVVGADDPAVIRARSQLASALF